MNIFTPYSEQWINAKILDDKRVVKMVLETTQLLSNALHLNNQSNLAPYKLTHKNHPCSLWAAESYGNFNWLTRYAYYINSEYSYRYSKIHACNNYTSNFRIAIQYVNFKLIQSTPLPNCTSYKNMGYDRETSYKLTLIDKWKNDKRRPTWYRQHKSDEEMEYFFDIFDSLSCKKS